MRVHLSVVAGFVRPSGFETVTDCFNPTINSDAKVWRNAWALNPSPSRPARLSSFDATAG
jgi:hypothetical protein